MLIDDNDPLWRQFERAVADFLVAVGPTAKVIHDHQQKDPDTGSRRQRDVWIEATLCSLFPIKALISCKRWTRKVDARDIEHFYGELSGANAHLGVIYSDSGFTETAVEKAKALGRGKLHCCQLYNHKPADLPQCLIVKECYCVASAIGTALVAPPECELPLKTWGDLFDIDSPVVSDLIKKTFRQLLTKAREDMPDHKLAFPESYKCDVKFNDSEDRFSFSIRVALFWKIYKADVEANLLNGSYCLTEDRFVGSQTTPSITAK